jgi:hypothetical protein
MSSGKNPLDWQKSQSGLKISKQSLYNRVEEKHNKEVERFLKKTERRTGKHIERDWDD